MMMDNRVFNVNGPLHEQQHLREGDIEMLADALKLAMRQHGLHTSVVGWSVIPNLGLALYWTDPKTVAEPYNRLLSPLGIGDAQPLAHMIATWLDTEEAKNMPHEGWDADCDHDGHNGSGWRVFVGDWGHVGSRWEAICCVRHAFMWYGK